MNNTKNNSKNTNTKINKNNNKNKKNNNVKVYTNNKNNNIKLTNSEFNSMRKWMKNEDNKDEKKGRNRAEEIKASFVEYHSRIGNKTKYAHMYAKEISELPESLQKLKKKYDKEVSGKHYHEVHVFEVQSMDDIVSADVEEDILLSMKDSDGKVIMMIYKLTDQNLRLYNEPPEEVNNPSFMNKIKNMFTYLMGGKLNNKSDSKPKVRTSKKIKEGDVIVLEKGAYISLESEDVGDDEKLGIIYLM